MEKQNECLNTEEVKERLKDDESEAELFQEYLVHLTDGSVVRVADPVRLLPQKNIVRHWVEMKDTDFLCTANGYFVPKPSILYISRGRLLHRQYLQEVYGR